MYETDVSEKQTAQKLDIYMGNFIKNHLSSQEKKHILMKCPIFCINRGNG